MIALILAFFAATAANKPAPAKIAPANTPAPADWSAVKKTGDYQVRLTLRPAVPQPGQAMEAIFDVAQIPEFTDSTYGDRVPVSGVNFLLTVSAPHASARYLVHAFGDAGAYGAHLRVAEKGTYTFALAPSGEAKGPSVDFQIGVGVPMPVAAQGTATDNARDPVGDHAAAAMATDPGRKLMSEIARRWADIDPEHGGTAASARAVADLLAGMSGKVPADFKAAAGEFDGLVTDAQATLSSYARGPTSSAAYLQTAQAACLRCHLKFRFGVTTEVARFPDVEVKPWKR